MVVHPEQLRTEAHVETGSRIQADAARIIERWVRRAAEDQPGAKRVHHQALLDHLSGFLWELGRSLVETTAENINGHCRSAHVHGEQRWEVGWSLSEVVRDYQILRLVILDYLEETLGRPLTGREVMAIGLVLDDAIAASVSSFTRHQQEAALQAERERAENERRAAEARHRERLELMQEASQRKDEFLGLLGHELRNPLAPLRNAVQILQLRASDPASVAWAQQVAQRQVQQLTRLVDDLLDVSRIGRGKILLRREPIDLASLVRTVVEDHRKTFENAHLHLTLQAPGVPVPIQGDSVRLAQVVSNLLNNALKFTDPGGSVHIHVSVTADNQARVAIRDTGIGIEPSLLPSLFDLYTQADRSLQRSRGGLGLGLALVKGLIEPQGGKVAITSDGPGKGTEVTFELPIQAQSAEPAAQPGAADPPGNPLRILIIEDNRDAADTLRILLEHARHQVVVAYTGPAGLEAAEQFRPNVVLCDLGLPGMDGLAVARAIRQLPNLEGTRLIAMTGYGLESDQQQTRDAGFEMHLTKPCNPEELLRVLDQPGGAATPT
jgi:two-component system CheB/CheR fusion protein